MKRVMTALLVVMAMASLASASILTYTVNFGDSYSGTFDITEVLNVPKFDPSLGTLQSVKLDYSVDVDGWVGFENINPTPLASITLKTYVLPTSDPYNTTFGDLALKFGTNTLASVSWTDASDYTFTGLTAYDGLTNYAGTSGASAVYVDKHDGGSATYTTNLETFIGVSPLELTYDLNGNAWIVFGFTGGNGNAKISTTGAGQVDITYTYTPEPATIALLGLGALALRRKKA